MGMGRFNDYINGLKPDANPYYKEQAERLLIEFYTRATVTDGVVRWTSNDRVPPSDILEFWHHIGKKFDYEKSLKVQEEENAAFLENYRKQMENYVPSQEERYEMEAAFGKGATVVNVLTGKKIDL